MEVMSLEKQLNWKNIEKEIATTKKVVAKIFAENISVIKQIAANQTRLTGIYVQEVDMKKKLAEIYEENIIVNNTLLNQPYWTYATLLLVENTLYGSARVLLRQFFESLLTAKYSEYDRSLIEKWEAKTEEKDLSKEIWLSKHVLKQLSQKNKTIKELENSWHRLSDLTHPTKYAQQVIRIPRNKKQLIEWIVESDFIQNTHYTLDLLFMLLCMNNHLLITHLGRKARGWYFGYSQDWVGAFKREKLIKNRIKKLIKRYFEINAKYKTINQIIKRNISEYRRNWA
jgi:hypothetical protein